jgi:hypothetical protein
VAERRIAVGDSDHERKFGLTEAIDVAERANELLRNKAIEGVAVRRDTGDLAINFGDETRRAHALGSRRRNLMHCPERVRRGDVT